MDTVIRRAVKAWMRAELATARSKYHAGFGELDEARLAGAAARAFGLEDAEEVEPVAVEVINEGAGQ